MKTSLLIPALIFGLAIALVPARAEDAAPVTLTPEMEAKLASLLKAMAEAKPEAAPTPDPTPQPATPQEARSAPPQVRATALAPSSLRTGSLTTGKLAPSAPLGGSGITGGSPRLSDDDWRVLFPAKQERK